MGGFLKFEKMITPIFIQLIFWLGFIGSILGGLAAIAYGAMSDQNTFLFVIYGLLVMFLGPLVIRIYCELLIVVFKMQSALIDIRNSLRENNDVLQNYQTNPNSYQTTTTNEVF